MEFAPFPPWVNTIRKEVRHLRIQNAQLLRANKTQKGLNTIQKEKMKKMLREKKRLEKENERLRREIEKYSKTINRYQIAIFDHGNFHSPQDKEYAKQKGGQRGHTNTNREQHENPTTYLPKHIFAACCTICGQSITRVRATDQKVLVDIALNPEVTKFRVFSERQWCTHCKRAVRAKDPQSLPFTEYGMNTFLTVLLLRYQCHLPFSKITLILSMSYGLQISESGVSSLLDQAKKYLGKKYEELQDIIRKGELMYLDETGWQVRGQGAWMWIMANAHATIYVAAESRGKGIAKEMYGDSSAYSMHDGYGGYTKIISSEKHLYCWAHLLRFCFEETIDTPLHAHSVRIRDTLVAIYRLKNQDPYRESPAELEKEVSRQIDLLLLADYQDDVTAKKLLHRLHTQRDGLIRALILSPNGTNNFAEQELRPIALSRKISYGSDTYKGMETTAVLASVVQTIARTKRDNFFPELAASIRAGVGKS
jgi:transposase